MAAVKKKSKPIVKKIDTESKESLETTPTIQTTEEAKPPSRKNRTVVKLERIGDSQPLQEELPPSRGNNPDLTLHKEALWDHNVNDEVWKRKMMTKRISVNMIN